TLSFAFRPIYLPPRPPLWLKHVDAAFLTDAARSASHGPLRACEKIAVVQAFRPAVSGGPDRLRQGYGGPPTSLRQGYGGPPKHLRRRKLYAEAEGPFYFRSDFFTGSIAGVATIHKKKKTRTARLGDGLPR